MSITICCKLTAKSWTMMPVPQDVITSIHNLSQKGHELNGIKFETNAHTPISNNAAIDTITAGVSEDDDLVYRSSDSNNSDYSTYNYNNKDNRGDPNSDNDIPDMVPDKDSDSKPRRGTDTDIVYSKGMS